MSVPQYTSLCKTEVVLATFDVIYPRCFIDRRATEQRNQYTKLKLHFALERKIHLFTTNPYKPLPLTPTLERILQLAGGVIQIKLYKLIYSSL